MVKTYTVPEIYDFLKNTLDLDSTSELSMYSAIKIMIERCIRMGIPPMSILRAVEYWIKHYCLMNDIHGDFEKVASMF